MSSRSNVRTKNITYNGQHDTDNFDYTGFWTRDASDGGQITTGLWSTSDPEATVSFNFPVPAIAFHYFGFLRPKGGLFSVCIDCDPYSLRFATVTDATNTTGDGENTSGALFSRVFDTPGQHVVLMRSENNTCNPAGNSSRLTIDRFVLEVVDDSTPVTQSSPSRPSSPPASNSGKSGPQTGAIVGGAVGGGLIWAIILTLIGFHYSRRRRKRLRSNQLVSAHDGNETDGNTTSEPILPTTTIVPYSLMHPSITKEERPKAGSVQPPRSSSTSSQSRSRNVRSNITAHFHLRRERQREADTESGPLEDDCFTLPPSYEDVFQAGATNRLPPGHEPNGHQSQPSTASVTMQGTAKSA
ncbi:hypothetical protein PQX77_020255 [Marasmius sp. AFHP31]|nr:hypothetical protein PQX77_020255 [Marasmius sp. AFHP31]